MLSHRCPKSVFEQEKSTNTSYPDGYDRLVRHFTRPSFCLLNSEEGQARSFLGAAGEQAHHANNENRKVPHGVSALRTQSGTGCPILPLPPQNSCKNKEQHTLYSAALGATGRIRTSGLPGRRTTTGWYRLTMKRELYWFCTFAAKTGKSLLSVITTGFSGISWCRCTVVVKWWSIFQTDGKGSLPLSLTISSFHSCF